MSDKSYRLGKLVLWLLTLIVVLVIMYPKQAEQPRYQSTDLNFLLIDREYNALIDLRPTYEGKEPTLIPLPQ